MVYNFMLFTMCLHGIYILFICNYLHCRAVGCIFGELLNNSPLFAVSLQGLVHDNNYNRFTFWKKTLEYILLVFR